MISSLDCLRRERHVDRWDKADTAADGTFHAHTRELHRFHENDFVSCEEAQSCCLQEISL